MQGCCDEGERPNILSSLLRHHVRPGLTGNEKSAEIADVLKELSNAPTAAEKHAIIERLLLREQRELLAAKTASAETPGFLVEKSPSRTPGACPPNRPK